MSLRPAAAPASAAATVGAPVRLGGEPSRLHLVLGAGQAAETSGLMEVFLGTLKSMNKDDLKKRLDSMKTMLATNIGIHAKMAAKQMSAKIEKFLKALEPMVKKERLEEFQNVKRKLLAPKVGNFGAEAKINGCDWDAYVNKEDACRELNQGQLDEIYEAHCRERDAFDRIMSLILYALRIAFMLD